MEKCNSQSPYLSCGCCNYAAHLNCTKKKGHAGEWHEAGNEPYDKENETHIIRWKAK